MLAMEKARAIICKWTSKGLLNRSPKLVNTSEARAFDHGVSTPAGREPPG
jgi:hypothetical protein